MILHYCKNHRQRMCADTAARFALRCGAPPQLLKDKAHAALFLLGTLLFVSLIFDRGLTISICWNSSAPEPSKGRPFVFIDFRTFGGPGKVNACILNRLRAHYARIPRWFAPPSSSSIRSSLRLCKISPVFSTVTRNGVGTYAPSFSI